MFTLITALIRQFILPTWTNDTTPDKSHFYRRCFTSAYLQKKSTVKNIWIGSGCIMLAFPNPLFVIPAIFFVIFLSFSILDES